MSTASSTISTGTLPWYELHHLALATRDLEATIGFYTDVLGMHAADIAPATPIHGRTCMIKPHSNATSELHFFEQADSQPIQLHPDMLQRLIFPMVGVHHIAFSLPDAATGLRLQERLQAAGIPTTPVMDQGDVYNLLFHDTNDLLLEANWPKA
jgi:catechol 2,3-dioxygenase-like lactoylglutathione lyase family enzyme